MNTQLKILSALMMAMATLPSLAADAALDPSADPTPTPAFEPGVVLVKPREGVADSRFYARIRAAGAEPYLKSRATGLRRIKVVPGTEALVVRKLKGDPGMERVGLNVAVKPDAVGTDPMLGDAWQLRMIQSTNAWPISTGSGVVAAVVDTGVTATNPDLAGKVLVGYNVVDKSTNTSDAYGHGTQVAGIIAATTNNALGVASIAYDANILPVRVTNKADGIAYSTDLANGITWAADHGAKVINVCYQLWNNGYAVDAAKYANRKGATVVTSIGNDHQFTTGTVATNMIVVGATRQALINNRWVELRADFSNYGVQLDFWAPGQYIPTTVGNGFGRFSGTSASAPVVAGVVAQLYAKTPALAAGAAERLLRDSADKLSGDEILAQGYGRVNAYKALALAEAKKADSAKPTVSFKTSNVAKLVRDPWGKVSVEVNASDNQYVNKVELYINEDTEPLDILSMPNYVFQFAATPYAGKTIYLTAKAYDLAGNVRSTAKTSFIVQ